MALREFKLFFSIDVLDVTIEDKLTFNLHTDRICKSISNQLNSLKRLKHFFGSVEWKTLINSFVISNFNYCPLVWMLTNAKSFRKIKAIKKTNHNMQDI